MTAKSVRSISTLVVALAALANGGAVQAQVDQQLDSVDAISNKVVLEMQLENRGDCGKDSGGNDASSYDCATSALPSSGMLPSDDPLFNSDDGNDTNDGIPGGLTSFAACQRSADRSLYCLLNSLTYKGVLRQPVTRWSDNGDVDDLFDCTDPELRLDGRRANPCTSITTDLAGNIWLGGRDGSSHSVIKVVSVAKGESCPAGFPATATLPAEPMRKLNSLSTAYDFCFLRYASGRPILVDMNAVDGRDATYFQGPRSAAGKGVLVLEDRRTAVFIADKKNGDVPVRPDPVEIASGKTGWGLVGNESVQSLTLLQLCPTVVPSVNGPVRKCGTNENRDNYALVTTSTGRVIARWTDPSAGTTVLPFQVYASPAPPSGATTVPQYWVRVSQQTGLVYVSDRSANKVRLLSVPVQFPAAGSTSFVLRDDTLWTSDATQSAATTSVPVPNTLNTISVSPGIGVDLSKCGVDALVPCDLYPDGGDANQVGAQISKVQLASTASGLAVFRITGIPDCRYPMPTSELSAICSAAGAVEGSYLRVDKLLPPEVLELFDETTTPKRSELKLLIGPQYRARPPGNTFDAFFGRTQDGVVFRETFDLKFDIGELTSSGSTRCGFDPGGLTTNPKNAANWDALVTVSERHQTVGQTATGSPTLNYQDMLVNSDCENPTSGSGDRWSLYAYGLMPTVCVNASSVDCKRWFATLLGDLFDDLEVARAETACKLDSTLDDLDGSLDGNTVTPLSASTCEALRNAWVGTKPKLDNCINAALERKQSAADENCQAFLSQFKQYEIVLDSATVNGGLTGDKANRLGELKARRNVLLYIYRDQFLPSIPFLP